MNYIAEYYGKIKKGELVVSAKVRKLYKHLNDKLENQSEFVFDENKANRAIEFIERFCHHSKGRFAGQRFKLELWQKALISALFGFVDGTGKRQYRELILIVARKNGKSALGSAIGIYMLIADGEGGAEIYSVARVVATLNWAKSVKAKVNT